MIISFVTMKGGSGKSTAAMCLAGQWMTNKKKVALLDSDPAATVLRWQKMGSDLADIYARGVISTDLASVADSLLGNEVERVIIDTPGFRSPVLEAAIRVADILIVPVKPSPIDFQVAADTVDLIEEIRGNVSSSAIRILISQCNRGSVINRHMRSEMTEAGYKILDGQLSTRVAYTEAALSGSTPTFTHPGSAAASEIAEFCAEIDSISLHEKF
ncbi:MAG: hypothetical protein EVA87_13185 [Rhodospirillaceae bacterium]|nr:MAG: hypothetical protein CBC23_002255 [Rhodospirillaceae bacterium TMED63]RZO35394.1 MAG: hypothetical protein EVA87_13185 [Rhodospirillaceae bacterium]